MSRRHPPRPWLIFVAGLVFAQAANSTSASNGTSASSPPASEEPGVPVNAPPNFDPNNGKGPQPVYVFCGMDGAVKGQTHRNAEKCGKIHYYVDLLTPSVPPINAHPEADTQWSAVQDKENPLYKQGYTEYKFEQNALKFRTSGGSEQKMSKEAVCQNLGASKDKEKGHFMWIEFKCDEAAIMGDGGGGPSSKESTKDPVRQPRFKRTKGTSSKGTSLRSTPAEFRDIVWAPMAGNMQGYFPGPGMQYTVNNFGLWHGAPGAGQGMISFNPWVV